VSKSNKKRLAVCFIFLIHFFLNGTLNCAADEKKKDELLYDQFTRAIVRLEEHRSICAPGLAWSTEKNVSIGTAFFVSDRLPGKENQGTSKYFIVTARHVAERPNDLFARVQKSPGSPKYFVLKLPSKLWVFHPDSTPKDKFPIDVAVMEFEAANFIKAFFHCAPKDNPDGCGISTNTKKERTNEVGDPPNVTDRAMFFGFPSKDISKKALQPFARSGIVAYTTPNPNLKISGRLLADDSVFYVDAPVFGGNSGGPVLNEILPLAGGIKLFGLVSGGAQVGRDYTIVTSVTRIRETIVYARSQKKLNKKAWSKTAPRLPIECKPDK